MPEIPDLARPLGDGDVRLRLAAEWDIPDILIAYQDDPHLHEHLGQDRPPSGAQLGSAAERYDDDRLAGTSVELTILDGASDDCRGRVTVSHFNWDEQTASVGIWVAPKLRGRGVARRALTLVARWLFEICGLERLQLLTEPDNEPMLHCARAAGFKQEGVLRSYGVERGHRVDLVIMSLLPGEQVGAE
jgi:RimJ/RimL family protein N-acetyltransferase